MTDHVFAQFCVCWRFAQNMFAYVRLMNVYTYVLCTSTQPKGMRACEEMYYYDRNRRNTPQRSSLEES
jgi:hypothetical protein